MKKVLEFEIQLANITLSREKRKDVKALVNPMTIRQLEQLDPSTPWLEYINTILPHKVQVEKSEIINVAVPSYIQSLARLTAKTPPRVLANYLFWNIVSGSLITYLTDAANKIRLKLSMALTGRMKERPRWKKCAGKVWGTAAVGSLYVSKYFNKKSKKRAEEMATEIRKEFLKMLGEVEWMDAITKKRAKRKAVSMGESIAYPSELRNMKKLEAYYEGLELSQEDFFGNNLNMSRFRRDYAFSKLRKKVNKTDWEDHVNVARANAFYDPQRNYIGVHAGILQGVYFSGERPQYLNFGAIGWGIGHEITHGFDDQGRHYDKDGNLLDWWQPETSRKYLEKADCFIKQYSNYSIPRLGNLSLNGIMNQGENIADNGGIKTAYRAYDSWVSVHGPEKLLPGLNYTQKQLLWISGAHMYCSKIRDKTLEKQILTGVHTPSKFRVQGTFSNTDDFAKDFKCKAGTRMNPNKKCIVW